MNLVTDYNLMCSLLLGNPNFKDPLSLSTSGLGDCKVARVGTPATDYKLVVRPWESGMRCIYLTICTIVCVSV